MMHTKLLVVGLLLVSFGGCRAAPPAEEAPTATVVSERRSTRMITQHQTEDPILNEAPAAGAAASEPEPPARSQPQEPKPTPEAPQEPKPTPEAPQEPKPPPKAELPPVPEEFQETLAALTGQRPAGGGNESLLEQVSLEDEVRLGEVVAARIAAIGLDEGDANLVRYLNLIAATLATVCDWPELPFHVAILNDNSVNALSALGGFVFVTRGAIRAAHDEAELAGVIAHEIAHCALRHAIRSLDSDKYNFEKMRALAELDRLTDQPNPELVNEMQGIIDDLLAQRNRPYAHQMEEEADRTAMIYLWRAGYQASALIDFLGSLDQTAQERRAMISHPPAAERVSKLKELLEQHSALGSGKRLPDRFAANTRGG